MKIAVDAMGGDHAPAVVVQGAVEAVKAYNIEILLIGDTAQIKRELSKVKGYPTDKIAIVHADEVIEMHESPTLSVRRKKKSSISIGVKLLKNNEAVAFVSAGNTGAVMCAATLYLGLLPGIERAGIALAFPTLLDPSMLIDVGANIDPKPVHLLQYGIMAEAYYKYVLGNKDNPSVGLLNVGEEESKGTDFMKEAHQLLSKAPINFIGNVEGRDIFSGKCDVIVCDGYVGNVALKVTESVAEMLSGMLKRRILKGLLGKLGTLLLLNNLKKFKKDIDYAEYGGAPLLGINGIVIIGHGRSSAKAVMSAIRVAKTEVERNVNEHIIKVINSLNT